MSDQSRFGLLSNGLISRPSRPAGTEIGSPNPTTTRANGRGTRNASHERNTHAFRAATDRAVEYQAMAAAQLADPRRFDRLTTADIAERAEWTEDYAR